MSPLCVIASYPPNVQEEHTVTLLPSKGAYIDALSSFVGMVGSTNNRLHLSLPDGRSMTSHYRSLFSLPDQ